jgi:NAD(P)-dependent dehydrogenase (short-subunit alcohol dehydrogenase family)
VAADVSTVEGCAAVADAARKQLGCIDFAVHVVGGSSAPARGFAVLDDSEWHNVKLSSSSAVPESFTRFANSAR